MEPQRNRDQSRSESRVKHRRQHHGDHHRKHRDEERPSGRAITKHRSTTLADRVDKDAQLMLSGDNNYVRRWLAETKEESPERPSIQKSLPRENGPSMISRPPTSGRTMLTDASVRESKASKVQRQLAHLEKHGRPPEKSCTRPSAKRKHNSSSDSSLLESPRRLVSKDEKRKVSKYHDHECSKRRRIELSAAAPSSISDVPMKPKETFEKRARHKTREDRYERKVNVPEENKLNATKCTTSKRLKKSYRSKPKKDGGELMRNFTSKSIGKERLTLRSSYGLGLFMNGRTSESTNTKGVPDLAFSGMEALEHTERPRQNVEMERMISKSREKASRKSWKPVEEIFNLSNQFRPPLHEATRNRGRAHSIATSYMLARPNQLSESPEFQGKRVQLDRIYLHSRYGAGGYAPDSSPKVSGRAMSYISWSDSHFSQPLPKSAQLAERAIRRDASPTPDSIRRSVESTGIYQGTGINVHADFTRSISQDIHERIGHVRHSRKHREPPSSRKDNTSRLSAQSTTNSCRQFRSTTPKKSSPSPVVARTSYDIGEGGGEEEFTTMKSRKPHPAKSLEPKAGTQRNIVEHSNQDSGWHEETPLERQSSRRFSDSTLPGNLPISREVLARIAKVRRPATTAPIVQITGPISIQAVHESKPETEKGDARPITEPGNETENLLAAQGPAPQSAQPPVVEDEPAHQVNSVESESLDPLSISQAPNHGGVGKTLHYDTIVAPSLNNPRFANYDSQSGPGLQVDTSTMLHLPLRGGMVQKFDPNLRTSSYCNVQPLFIKQIQANNHYHQIHDPGGLQIFQTDTQYQNNYDTEEVQNLQNRTQYQLNHQPGGMQRLQSASQYQQSHSPRDLQQNEVDYFSPQQLGGAHAEESEPFESLNYESVVYLQDHHSGSEMREHGYEGVAGDDELLYSNNARNWQNRYQYNDDVQNIDNPNGQLGDEWYAYGQQQGYRHPSGPGETDRLLFGENMRQRSYFDESTLDERSYFGGPYGAY